MFLIAEIGINHNGDVEIAKVFFAATSDLADVVLMSGLAEKGFFFGMEQSGRQTAVVNLHLIEQLSIHILEAFSVVGCIAHT